MPARAKSWEEYKTECETIAKEGIRIIGFVEPWKGSRTKLLCDCKIHGQWNSTIISNFKKGNSCPKCAEQTIGKLTYKSWDVQKKECQEIAKKGITVLAYTGPWEGACTKLVCHCEKHGDWSTTTIKNFKMGNSCPECAVEKTKKCPVVEGLI